MALTELPPNYRRGSPHEAAQAEPCTVHYVSIPEGMPALLREDNGPLGTDSAMNRLTISEIGARISSRGVLCTTGREIQSLERSAGGSKNDPAFRCFDGYSLAQKVYGVVRIREPLYLAIGYRHKGWIIVHPLIASWPGAYFVATTSSAAAG
jgi:hypothetical protein